MTRQAGIWAAALAGSFLLHLGGYLLVEHHFGARPIPTQPAVTSQLAVQPEPVRHNTAKTGDTRGQATPEETATGQTIAAGAIAQATARPVETPDTSLLAAPPPDTKLGPAIPVSTPTRPTLLPVVHTGATAPLATPVVAGVTPARPTAPVTATGTPVAQAPLPAATPADARVLPSETLVVQHPTGEAITADLAFWGATQDIDPQSLAAFQSFTKPGDLTTGADPLRDGVAAVLSQVPCARLQVAFDPQTATLNLRGHVPDSGLKPAVLELLQQQMGTSITVSDKMALLPRPQCGALQAIERVGLPQSTDQITNPALLGADAHVRTFNFRAGELLFLDLTGPDYPAYVYVDYLDAAGHVLHLSPNTHAPLIELAPKQPFSVGARAGQTTGLQLVIAPPFGQEIVVAFAASHPLYDGTRPLVEPAAPYLDWLKTRVAAQRVATPEFKGEWVYFLVSTGP